MKIIDLVEYLRDTFMLKHEICADGRIINQFTGPVCTANPEEAEQIVQYLIEGLLINANESQKNHPDTFKITSAIGMTHYEDGRVETNGLAGETGAGFWLPPVIDESSYQNILNAISQTGVFEIEQHNHDNTSPKSVTSRFHTTYNKLSSYISGESTYTQSSTPKKL